MCLFANDLDSELGVVFYFGCNRIESCAGRTGTAAGALAHHVAHGLGILHLVAQVRDQRVEVCPAVRPLLDRLQAELNFFVSSELRQTILRLANEDV